MDRSKAQVLAKELAVAAIATLAASASGGGVAGVVAAGAATGATRWLERVTAGWGQPAQDFIGRVERQLPALAERLGLSEEASQVALAQAKSALGKAGLSAQAFARLDFDPARAAEAVALASGHHEVGLADSPARAFLQWLYECLPHDPGQYRRLDVAFQQAALQMLHSNDAQLQQIAERLGWAALLYLPAPPWRRHPTPAMLLDPALDLVAYRERADGADDELQRWLAGETDIALRIYGAEGGAGKTRFMRHHCLRASACGWRVGFLSGAEEARTALPRAYESLFAETTPTLVVVDYAESRTRQLARLLAAAQRAPRDSRLRIVLLTRRIGGHWWEGFKARADAEVRNLIEEYPPESLGLQPLVLSQAARADLYQDAFTAFADRLDTPGEAAAMPDLAASHFQLPLFVLLAALDRLLGGSGAGDESTLLSRMLDHERRYWRRGDLDPEAVQQAMATLTLWQGAGEQQLTELPRRWPATRKLHQVPIADLFGLLHDLYAGQGEDGHDQIMPLRPDRLGECLIGETLEHDAEALAQAAFGPGASAEQRRNGFTVLARLPLSATDHLARVGRQLAGYVRAEGDLAFAAELMDQLPEQSLGLAELATVVTQTVFDHLAGNPDESAAYRAERARVANNLANVLSALGRREAALTAAEEAVELRRRLAQERPDAFTPDLATSLNNLANCLSDLGRREAALTAAEEAVELRRRLAQERPDAFTPDLAMSLNNLANVLSALGRREAALTAAEEAVELRRRLAQERPDAFTPDLAASLNNLASFLSALGRREAALTAAEEAVELYRRLAQERPDAFTPNLATSLNNLASFLSALGRREAALAAAEEAVELYRRLAQERPDAFTPDLAMSLNNLANCLSALGRREAALTAAEEAVELRRRLAQERPDAFTPNLAMSLNNLANVLSALGRREAALTAAEEAVELYRRLAQERPDAFTPDLAMSLGALGAILKQGDQGAGRDRFAEAIALLSPLFLRVPQAFAPLMGALRHEYLDCCQQLGEAPDAALLGPLAAMFETLPSGEDGPGKPG